MKNKKILNIDQLLLFSLAKLINENKQAIFENIVVESFRLFPGEFGLKGFINKYPDSSRVDKSWRRCRADRKWISGSVAHGFIITSTGMRELEKIEEIFENKNFYNKKLNIQHGDKRTKSGRIVEHIEKHKAYLKYKEDPRDAKISDYEACELVFCTLDSFPETRRKNINEMKRLVTVYKRNDILKFLEWIENYKNNLF